MRARQNDCNHLKIPKIFGILCLFMCLTGITAARGSTITACVDNDTTACALETSRSSSDPNFIASNIANGVNILGITGTYTGGACIAPSSCSNVGDVCSDGSIFAGFMIYNNASSCSPLYVTADNQSAGTSWRTTDATSIEINPVSYEDGKINAANRSGSIANFPAFDLCESNTYHGKNDWYLPAINELYLLSINRTAIDANAVNNFQPSGIYWSSTENEYSYQHAFATTMGSNRGKNTQGKTQTWRVRCVRRD